MVTPNLSAALWRKSSHSNGQGGNCIEVACNVAGVRAVRDSKDPAGSVLVFTPAEFAGFVRSLKTGPLGG